MTMEHPATTLKRLEQRARKRFGQNFLVSERALDRIVRLAKIDENSKVVEIGPGLGALSKKIAETKCHAVAVEVDRDLAQFLRTEIPTLNVFDADATTVDWDEVCPGDGWTVVANLPYNVATPIVTKLITLHPKIIRCVLMFQQEVAHRLIARPGTKAFGSLSVWVQAHSKVSWGFKLPPGAFYPSPKVHSAVVKFEPYDEPLIGGVESKWFERVVKGGFSQRRKMLENALSSQFDKALVRQATEATVGGKRRAEELDIADWALLAAALRDVGAE
jgi:16S rRNA (adenine1518-N6/adenine1519-N6)-dimethyltransferase